MELWEKDGKLVQESEWKKLIESLKTRERIKDKEEAKRRLREKLVSAIIERIPNKKFGVLFSGGVDSSFIAAVCQKEKADFTCYTVGFQDEGTNEPEDVKEAGKVAQQLGLHWKKKICLLKEAEEIIKETVRILKPVKKTDVVNVGVGAVILAASKLAQEDGISYLFSGLGSEEIFAGYERHDKAQDKNEECWEGLKKMWSRDLVRDFALAQELDVIIRTPFLDSELIKTAMQVPVEWKISKDEKKIILREIAQEYLGGLAWRKKKAAQYGSCFDKAIGKLARKNKFIFKKEWLERLQNEIS